MTAKNTTESLANSSNENRSVFYCPEWPQFIWDMNHTTSKIIVAITTIACPVTVLLNLLLIIAVKTRTALKKNSNILLSSLAFTDLLVGAVAMPLSIASDALVIQRVLVADVICTINFIGVSIMYTVCSASFLHLLLIAWERYVAVAKWMDYRAIVTRGRINKYTRVAWLLAVLWAVPSVALESASVRFETLLVVDVILSIFWFVCLSLIAYFYVKAYLAVRKWNRTRIQPVNVLVKRKIERKFAYTTFWLTVFFAVSGFPSVVVYLFRAVSPFFRQVSTIRWAETILKLNSLFNPLLYWYRTRRLRKASLELLRCKKKPAARAASPIRQRRYSVALLDVETFQCEQLQKHPRILRSKSLNVMICSDTFRQRSRKAVKERPVSAPSTIASEEVFTNQRNPGQLILTVQIENAPGEKGSQGDIELQKNTTELGRSRRHIGCKIVRSCSLNESSLVSITKCHQNATKRSAQRSRSVPIISTNSKESNDRTTFRNDELTNENGLACNRYEETKL